MAYDPSNLFAKIIAGEIPSHKIFETPHAVAILDAFPLVEGHALLLPKHPCVDVTDMPPDVAASVLKELPRLARLVQQATGADGVNIAQNSGKAAGQVVFHCHFHVIPRFDSDQKPIAFGASRKSMISGDEAASVLSRMKEPYAGSLSAIEELMGEMRAGSVTKPAAADPLSLSQSPMQDLPCQVTCKVSALLYAERCTVTARSAEARSADTPRARNGIVKKY